MSDHKRRLAAVMFTDIYGYSAKMSRDENAALGLLKEHNRLLNEIFARHSGRVLKTMGDAFFTEFDAAFSAVACAIEIQSTLKSFNEAKPTYEQVHVRIGLHLGDVIVDGDDLYGEGVNVAARLQPLAEPGGICMSQAVYQAVKSHTALEAVHGGEVELKNIVEKYVVYKIPSFNPPAADDAARAVERRVAADAAREVERRAAPGVLNFKVKSVQKWPTVGRSRWLYVTKWTAIYHLATILSLLPSILGDRLLNSDYHTDHTIFPQEIESPNSFISKLREPNDPVSVFLSSQFRNKLVDQLQSHDDDSEHSISTAILLLNICTELHDIIHSPNVWNIPEYYLSNPLASARYAQALEDSLNNPEALDFKYQLLWDFYRADLQHRSLFDTQLGMAMASFKTSEAWVSVILETMLALSVLIFISSPVSLRVTFPDLRDVDHGVAFLTTEMRFKRRRTQDSRGIHFRRWGFLGSIFQNLGGMRVRVEGNTILVTSSNIVIQRAKKLFKLHLDTEAEQKG